MFRLWLVVSFYPFIGLIRSMWFHFYSTYQIWYCVFRTNVELPGSDRTSLSTFYTTHFYPSGPPSQHIRLLSRTVGPDRIVDEVIVSFRHTEEIPWILPHVPPTDRDVRVPLVMTASFCAGKLAQQNLYWDQASVLVQVGLLDPMLIPGGFKATGKTRDGREMPGRLPVIGVEGAERVLNG